jgi:glutamate carboxypeptidase
MIRFSFRARLAALCVATAPAVAASQSTLSKTEVQLRDVIVKSHDDQIAYLQRVVDIPSNTLNLDGVRKVGSVFRASLDSLGFTTSWAAQPDAMQRAGHLVAEHKGKVGAVPRYRRRTRRPHLPARRFDGARRRLR